MNAENRQLLTDLDREKAETLGVPVSDVYDTLQARSPRTHCRFCSGTIQAPYRAAGPSTSSARRRYPKPCLQHC